jgi:predicted acetyltransferase
MYKIELLTAPIESKIIIKNLARFYVYELSRYSDNLPGWEFPEDGLYEAKDKYFHYDKYWSDPGYFPFLIRVDNELAGFSLVKNSGLTPDVEWNLVEFYIVAKFQGQGIGREIAKQLLDKFSGVWQLMQMPQNTPAIAFWRTVLNEYTNGHFSEEIKILPDPVPHEMNVMKFKN